MNRQEALRILGLSQDATVQDIKLAYRELAQIMHPDRFAQNERLAKRTAEQFKLITQAKDYLLTNGHAVHSSQVDKSDAANSSGHDYIRRQALRISIEALHIQLDEEHDRRKRNLGLIALGIVLCVIFRVNPVSIVGSFCIIQGGFGVMGAQTAIRAGEKRLAQLRAERDALQG